MWISNRNGAVALNSTTAPFLALFWKACSDASLDETIGNNGFYQKIKTSAPIGKRRFMVKYQYEIRKYFTQRKECLDRITSEKGVQLRVNRSIQAEGAFALWKEDQKFRQFLCRGQANVYAESVLTAIAQNIENLHRHIQKGQLGQHLYEV